MLRCSYAQEEGIRRKGLGKQNVLTALAVDIKIKNIKLKIKNAVAHF